MYLEQPNTLQQIHLLGKPLLLACCISTGRYTRRSAQPASPTPSSSSSAAERLEAAEKVAEQFVKQRIKPALRRAQEVRLTQDLLAPRR